MGRGRGGEMGGKEEGGGWEGRGGMAPKMAPNFCALVTPKWCHHNTLQCYSDTIATLIMSCQHGHNKVTILNESRRV